MWTAEICNIVESWARFCEEEEKENSAKSQIKVLLDGQNFVMFFKKDDCIYGADEDGRLTFAKMKNPDDETGDDWADEASFAAVNLTRALKGARVHNLFSKKDLKKLQVVDKEEAEAELLDQAKGKQVSGKIGPKEPEEDQPVGTIQIKDKKK